MSDDVVLFQNDRRDGKRLVVSWRLYEGYRFVDLRIHVKGDDGEFHPTKQGISVKLAELFNVTDALARACDLAKEIRR